MRRLAVILASLLALPLLLGQTVVYMNSVVVEWDAPATLADGSPIPVGMELTYEVLIAPATDKQAYSLVIETALLEATVTALGEGDWLVGVRALRYIGEDRYESDILWSDGTTDPFVLRYYLPPAVPEGLRLR